MPDDELKLRMADNFIYQYGRPALRRFLKLLERGDSGEKIAREFGVSRERVRQWKNAFGQEVRVYDVHPEIRKAAGLKKR